MNISDILGDAFLADKRLRAPQEFGVTISQSHTVATYDASSAIDPKCNLVGTLKADCEKSRNSIASNGVFVCYSVKGVSIRVIHTSTAEKDLLRGTEALTDMQFSSIDSYLLCSSTAATITVWRLISTENSLSSEVVCLIPLGADMITPHPVLPDVWAVAHKHQIALFSTKHVSTSPTSYAALGTHLDFMSTVVDMAFTPSGSHLAVAAGFGRSAAVGIFTVPSGSLSSTSAKLSPYSMLPCPHIVGLAIPRTIGSSISLLTLTETAEDAKTPVSHLLLRAWTLSDGHAAAEAQSVQVELPHTDGFKSTSEHRYSLELQRGENPQVVVVHDRASAVVACFTLSSKLPLCRYVYLSLQWNIVSLVVHSVRGVDSSTSEEVEYLELACYQRDTVPSSQQTAVKQYHIPLSCIAAPAHIENGLEHTSKSNSNNSESVIVHAESPVVKPQHFPAASPPVLAPQSSSAGSVVAAILAPSAAVVAGSFPDFALKKSTPAVPTSNTPAMPTDGDIATRSKDILLNALRARPVQETASPTPVVIPKHKIESQKSADITIQESKSSKQTKQRRSSSEAPTTPALDVSNVDRDWENASLSASGRRFDDALIEPRLQHLEDSVVNIDHTLKDLQKISMRTSKHVLAQVEANEAWQRSLSSQLASSLKAELVSETVAAIKMEMSHEFREAFERTLVPAFQRGVAEAFTQLQDEVSASVTRLKEDLQRVVHIKMEENRELCKQIKELRCEVQTLTSIIEGSGLRSRTTSVADSCAVRTCELQILLSEGRYGDALELALELKDVSSVVKVLGQWTPNACMEECDDTVLLCTLQQLSADLASHEPQEGMSLRLEWMKELVMSLSSITDVRMQPALEGTLTCLRAAEARHSLTGSARTDMRMMVSIIGALKK